MYIDWFQFKYYTCSDKKKKNKAFKYSPFTEFGL